MAELLFVLVFAVVLIATGASLIGVVAALVAGFIVMALIGMLGIVVSLLPWLLAAWLVVWFYKNFISDQRGGDKVEFIRAYQRRKRYYRR
uniref:envelope stress response protein PspG n=1 Tax=Thaumasiovibrio occultus TaxID=1891184 RepID=UPI000D339D1E|nr:envelope stress response protein PspG [Thaumasiovibrio occultus]